MPQNTNVFNWLFLFYFSKDNWEEYPIVTLQTGLIFGAVQSGTFLELVLDQVADKAENPMAKVTIRHLRQVDNMLASVRTKKELEMLGAEVPRLMCKFSLPLQIRYATSKEAHPNWLADVPQEMLLGYW